MRAANLFSTICMQQSKLALLQLQTCNCARKRAQDDWIRYKALRFDIDVHKQQTITPISLKGGGKMPFLESRLMAIESGSLGMTPSFVQIDSSWHAPEAQNETGPGFPSPVS